MLKRPLQGVLRQCAAVTRARVVRTALLLSVWQREVKIEGFRLQGASLLSSAAVTRCLNPRAPVGDMGEGSVTAPGVKHGEMSGMGNLQP